MIHTHHQLFISLLPKLNQRLQLINHISIDNKINQISFMDNKDEIPPINEGENSITDLDMKEIDNRGGIFSFVVAFTIQKWLELHFCQKKFYLFKNIIYADIYCRYV